MWVASGVSITQAICGLGPNSFQLVQTRQAAFLIGQPNPDFKPGH
jgi:hypothetical protein